MHLKRMVLTVALGLAALGARAQQADIAATIDGQLQAFAQRDAAAAFSYASPTIHQLFGTPENFAAMVQTGYPMVWTPSDARMLDLHSEAGALWQRVHVTDTAGRGWILDYQMVQTPDGWKINAVDVQPATDVGA